MSDQDSWYSQDAFWEMMEPALFNQQRLQDQASTLAELLHADTSYPPGSRVLEAGCGVGAQTITLAKNSPDALITAVDIAATSLVAAERRVAAAGLRHVQFEQADIFNLPYAPDCFDHIFVCFVLEHLSRPIIDR